MRGEHEFFPIIDSKDDGSPPRAWGACRPVYRPHHLVRFTPTCVGSMSGSRYLTLTTSVHPHVRGEHRSPRTLEPWASGSPPRAWGALHPVAVHFGVSRFTPTCVGSMFDIQSLFRIGAVHPHVRGEHDSPRRCHLLVVGSPPRAWGASPDQALQVARIRFTPTCVGSIGRHASGKLYTTVHPHVRGEHISRRWTSWTTAGSPPRAWGALRGLLAFCSGLRFTPTCVGSILPPSSRHAFFPVHPHMRGEHEIEADRWQSYFGSPPHAWGA